MAQCYFIKEIKIPAAENIIKSSLALNQLTKSAHPVICASSEYVC